MTQQLHDLSGAPVTVRLDEARPISAYTANLADGTLKRPRFDAASL